MHPDWKSFNEDATPEGSSAATDQRSAWRQVLMKRCEQELREIGQANLADIVNQARPGLLDVLFAYRLLLGRWPEFNSIEGYENRLGNLSLDEFVRSFLQSSEFQARNDQAGELDLIVSRQLPGMRLFFNLNDRQSLRIAAGHHEPEIQRVMRQLLKPGAHAIDVGAHIGLYTLLMAQAGGHVWSFEPLPASFELLRRNVAENGFESTVHLSQAACYAHAGVAKLYLREAADLGPVYIQPAEQADRPLESIAEAPMVRIDDVVPPEIRIDLVKLDIEGNELFALRGMRRIVERDRPILFAEFLPHAMGVRPDEYLGWLGDEGYEVYDVVEFSRGEQRPYVFHDSEPSANLVCLPR